MTECTPTTPNACATNMGTIHLQAGDLVGAYRYFQPLAEAGDVASIQQLIDICERAGDADRAASWRQKLPSATTHR